MFMLETFSDVFVAAYGDMLRLQQPALVPRDIDVCWLCARTRPGYLKPPRESFTNPLGHTAWASGHTRHLCAPCSTVMYASSAKTKQGLPTPI
jgi:hypothetical protein